MEAGAEIEVEIDDENAVGLVHDSNAAEEALSDATHVGVGLYKNNPFFKEAILVALKELGPDAPLPSFEAVDIDYCSPGLLDATTRHLPKE